jgi:hypothetical protein
MRRVLDVVEHAGSRRAGSQRALSSMPVPDLLSDGDDDHCRLPRGNSSTSSALPISVRSIGRGLLRGLSTGFARTTSSSRCTAVHLGSVDHRGPAITPSRSASTSRAHWCSSPRLVVTTTHAAINIRLSAAVVHHWRMCAPDLAFSRYVVGAPRPCDAETVSRPASTAALLAPRLVCLLATGAQPAGTRGSRTGRPARGRGGKPRARTARGCSTPRPGRPWASPV